MQRKQFSEECIASGTYFLSVQVVYYNALRSFQNMNKAKAMLMI